jgi:hypothetical protein
MPARKAVEKDSRLGGDLQERLAGAMHELRAEIDGHRQTAGMARPDAAADAVARFEQNNRETGARKDFGRSETRGARSHDDDVRRSVGQG